MLRGVSDEGKGPKYISDDGGRRGGTYSAGPGVRYWTNEVSVPGIPGIALRCRASSWTIPTSGGVDVAVALDEILACIVPSSDSQMRASMARKQ